MGDNLPTITDDVLDQWEASALKDHDAGHSWSVNPLAVLAIVKELRQHRAGLGPVPPVRNPVATATIPEDVYDALLRLASTHRREVCECDNCPPERAMTYDDCKCGDDWSGCVDDVATVEAFVPRPWGWRDE